jgi:hypothetical protein
MVERRRPIVDVEPHDADTAEPVARPRTLSFVTLSRSKQARLFFGLNEDGLLGLHFRAVSQRNADLYLDLRRSLPASESGTDAGTNPRTE